MAQPSLLVVACMMEEGRAQGGSSGCFCTYDMTVTDCYRHYCSKKGDTGSWQWQDLGATAVSDEQNAGPNVRSGPLHLQSSHVTAGLAL